VAWRLSCGFHTSIVPNFDATFHVKFASLTIVSLVLCQAGCAPPDRSEPPLFTRVDSLLAPPGPGSGQPNLAVDDDGRVLLSWLERQSDSSYSLQLSVRNGDAWSSPSTIVRAKNLFVNWADFPSVLALPGGRLAAHWLQRSGTGRYAYDVRVALSDDGGDSWRESFLPHRDGSQTEHGFVSMWRTGDSLSLVWLDGRRYDAAHGGSNEMMLVTTTVGPDGGLGAETLLDERICDCCQTSVAHTQLGPAIVYRDRSPGEVRDIAITRLVDGAWTDPALVHPDGWQINACPVNGPSISARRSRVAVAWFTAAGDRPRVRLAFSSDAGATFGDPLEVDHGNPEGRVAVSMLDDASALVAWIERTRGDSAEVRVRRVWGNGRMTESVAIATATAERASGFPRMVVVGDDVIFAWTARAEQSVIRLARARLTP
jgi:hypothetical protein